MGRGLFFGLEIDIWCFLSHHQNIQVQELRDRNKRIALTTGASPAVLVVKNPPANEGDGRDMGFILGLGRSPGGEQGNPLQYSCLENPMDRGSRQATVHRVDYGLTSNLAYTHTSHYYT